MQNRSSAPATHDSNANRKDSDENCHIAGYRLSMEKKMSLKTNSLRFLLDALCMSVLIRSTVQATVIAGLSCEVTAK